MGQLGLISYPQGQFRQVTRDTSNYFSLTVSSDGRTAASVQVRVARSLYLLNGQGAQTVQLPAPLPQAQDVHRFNWMKDGTLLVNELAPRPHNSYHASERACATSQFEQCVRAVCDLPLGSVEIQKPAAIANLLGDVWLANAKPNFSAALAVPGVRLHLYDKQIPKAGRKMGHISAVGATPEEAVERVQRARAAL